MVLNELNKGNNAIEAVWNNSFVHEREASVMSRGANALKAEDSTQVYCLINSRSPKTVLITGGAGFIGSHIVDKFIDCGSKVVVADNFSAVNSGYRNSKAEYIDADILSDEFENVFQKYSFDICVHLAAQVSVSVSEQDPYKDAQTNILGSVRVIELCKKYGVSKMLVSSSAAVYGMPEDLPIDEKHSTLPLSGYGLSKLTMEKYLQLSGLPYVIFRFANVYGERQTASGEAGVVAIFDKCMKENQPVRIDGDGLQTRDFVYVKDVAGAVCKAALSDIKNEIINIGTNTSISILELFKTMAAVYGYTQTPVYASARKGDIRDSVLNNKKCRTFGLIDEFCSIKDGLIKMFNGGQNA